MTPLGTLGLCCLHIPPCVKNPLVTVYLAVMLQASRHTADVN